MIWGIIAATEGIVILILLFGMHRIAQKLKEAERLTLEDPLTGIGNRRKLDIAFNNAYISACRGFFPRDRHRSHSFPIAIMTIDMDQLKGVNDTRGHDAGDYLIKTLAEKITENIRETDMVARIKGKNTVARTGGDEFCLLLMNVHESTCIRIAKHVSIGFQEHVNGWKNPPTISVGLRIFESREIVNSPEEIRKMFDEADRRLLLAKSGGKNQLVGNNDVSVPL